MDSDDTGFLATLRVRIDADSIDEAREAAERAADAALLADDSIVAVGLVMDA